MDVYMVFNISEDMSLRKWKNGGGLLCRFTSRHERETFLIVRNCEEREGAPHQSASQTVSPRRGSHGGNRGYEEEKSDGG